MALNAIASASLIAGFAWFLWWVWRHQHDQELCRWCGRPAGYPPNAEHVHWVHDATGAATGCHRWSYCSTRCMQLSLVNQPQEEGTP